MAGETCVPGEGEQLVRLVLDQISDKWSILIMAELCRGPMRFNALRRDVTGITQKSLTQALRRLERSGIIARRVIPVSPVAVEYSVTPLGETLVEPLRALMGWASLHREGVEAAQNRFDRESGVHAATEAATELRVVGRAQAAAGAAR